MPRIVDGTKLPSHDMFYMEGIGGCPDYESKTETSSALPEHAPSCFGFEEERGEQWTGAGSANSTIKESRPTL
jgi:hypothetical protein